MPATPPRVERFEEAALQIVRVLFSQGFGTRRECEALVQAGAVRANGVPIEDPLHDVATDGLVLNVEGMDWPFHERALLMLHKPAGTECSQRPSAWPSVLSLLPAPLRRRGVQPVGRLDADTTGLLLLTDDGALSHRLTSPKHGVRKTYEATTDAPVTATMIGRLLEGVVLRDDPRPLRAAACEPTGEHALRLVLTGGRYHQVKRMIAAAGNHVVSLHRSGFGGLVLPPDLMPGQWRWLGQAERLRLERAGAAQAASSRGAARGTPARPSR